MPLHLISRQAQMIKSYYSGIGKTPVMYLAAFLMVTALGNIGFGMIFYLRDTFGATGGQVGIYFGLWPCAYVIGCLFFRPLTDSIKPRYLLIVSTFSMFACMMAILHCRSFALACAFNTLAGAACSLFWPPMMGWLSVKLHGAELSRVMSRFNMSWSSGAIVSPYMAGWLSAQKTALPVQVGAGLMLLTSFLILGAALSLPKLRDDGNSSQPDPEETADTGRPTRLRYAAWIGLFAAFTVVGVLMNIFPLSARDDLNLAKPTIGVLLLSRTLFTTIGFMILGRLVCWHYRGSQMLLGQLGIVGCLVGMIFLPQPVLIGSIMAIFGVASALSYFNSLFHGMSGSSNRVGRSAIHEALLSGGVMTGSVLGGQVYQHFSIQKVYGFCIALVTLGLVMQTLIVAWAAKRETHPSLDTTKGAEHNEG